jgi:hypothetical protein
MRAAWLTGMAVALLLGACSGGGKSAAPAASGGSPAQGAAEPARPVRDERRLPHPDLSTPDSAYVPLTSGTQLMFLYNAFSGLPPDFERMANESSDEYQRTSDNFRKQDLLAALKPQYEARIADAKAHPYVLWQADWTHIEHYDMARKGFPLLDSLLSDGGSGYMSDVRGYSFTLGNSEGFRFLSVTDEARAREIEAMMAHTSFPIRIYAFVQGADDQGGRNVRAHVVKVQILERNSGRVLIEQRAED